jgi:putative hydrolase of the HAD superfamily
MPAAIPNASLVCFDLGRVLVRICSSWAEAFSLAGLDPGAAPHAPDPSAAPLRDALSARVHAFEIGALSVDEFAGEAAALLDRSTGDVHRVIDAWVRGATPGATVLLDELAARGHRIACLSNTNARHWELMSTWQDEADRLWPRLQLRLASHELGLRKPDDAIFAALELAGGVAASEIVFFDDLPDNVAAARARGWRAVEVCSREDPVSEMRAWLREAGLL